MEDLKALCIRSVPLDEGGFGFQIGEKKPGQEDIEHMCFMSLDQVLRLVSEATLEIRDVFEKSANDPAFLRYVKTTEETVAACGCDTCLVHMALLYSAVALTRDAKSTVH